MCGVWWWWCSRLHKAEGAGKAWLKWILHGSRIEPAPVMNLSSTGISHRAAGPGLGWARVPSMVLQQWAAQQQAEQPWAERSAFEGPSEIRFHYVRELIEGLLQRLLPIPANILLKPGVEQIALNRRVTVAIELVREPPLPVRENKGGAILIRRAVRLALEA